LAAGGSDSAEEHDQTTLVAAAHRTDTIRAYLREVYPAVSPIWCRGNWPSPYHSPDVPTRLSILLSMK
jgi:hypothetical protein